MQVELAYFDHGGILQYVIRNLINAKHWISHIESASHVDGFVPASNFWPSK